MSVAGAIRAGAAYVEVFLESNRVSQGLAAVQAKLRGWSASLGRMGAGAYGGELPGPLAAIARFASSPAGMFAGLLTAAKMAATAGDGMVHLAEKAGTSVESISALAYAARRADVNTDSLAMAVKKMQVNIVTAARGGKEAAEVFAHLGLSAAEIGRLRTEDQFRRIADRIAAIQNPAERAATAVKIFGRNGTELMPLLLQGADGIAKWEARAKALGLVIDGEAAEGAHRFSQLLGDLHDVMMSGVRVIGGAIIPELTRFVDWIIKGTGAVRDWIKEHKGIVVTALQVAGAIVAGGVALAGMSALLRNMASAISLVLVPLRLFSSLLAGLTNAALGIAATIVGAAWTTAAVAAHLAWAALGALGSLLGVAFSAAATVASIVWTATAALASLAWTAASIIASAAWVAGSVVVSAAWSALMAIPGLLGIAWSAAAAVASAAWTAVALALDAILTFAATGAMALPALIVAGVVAGIALLGAEIYLQLSRWLSRAPEIGKQAGQEIQEAAVTAAADASETIGGDILDALKKAATTGADAFRQTVGAIGGYFSELWSGMSTDAAETFGAIGNALMAGKIMQAWPVITAFAKLEWERISLFAQQTFSTFLAWWGSNKDRLLAPILSMAQKMREVLDKIKDQINALATLYHAVFGYSTTMRQDRFEEFKARTKDTLAGANPQDQVKALDDWLAKSEAYKKRMLARGDQKAADEEDDKQKWVGEERARILRQSPASTESAPANDKFAEQQDRIDKLKKELDEARKNLEADIAKPPDKLVRDKLPGEIPDISNLAAAKASVVGTFSGAALSGLGTGNSIEEKMEGHLAKIAINTDQQNAALERLERNMADGLMLA